MRDTKLIAFRTDKQFKFKEQTIEEFKLKNKEHFRTTRHKFNHVLSNKFCPQNQLGELHAKTRNKLQQISQTTRLSLMNRDFSE